MPARRPIARVAIERVGRRRAKIESVVETADIFITATGNTRVIRPEHVERMKHLAIVANVAR